MQESRMEFRMSRSIGPGKLADEDFFRPSDELRAPPDRVRLSFEEIERLPAGIMLVRDEDTRMTKQELLDRYEQNDSAYDRIVYDVDSELWGIAPVDAIEMAERLLETNIRAFWRDSKISSSSLDYMEEARVLRIKACHQAADYWRTQLIAAGEWDKFVQHSNLPWYISEAERLFACGRPDATAISFELAVDAKQLPRFNNKDGARHYSDIPEDMRQVIIGRYLMTEVQSGAFYRISEFLANPALRQALPQYLVDVEEKLAMALALEDADVSFGYIDDVIALAFAIETREKLPPKQPSEPIQEELISVRLKSYIPLLTDLAHESVLQNTEFKKFFCSILKAQTKPDKNFKKSNVLPDDTALSKCYQTKDKNIIMLTEQVLQQWLTKYGLPDTIVAAWKDSYVANEAGEDMTSIAVMNNFMVMQELERRQPRSTKDLEKHFNIRAATRYPVKFLLEQDKRYVQALEKTPDQYHAYGVLLVAQQDENGAFFKLDDREPFADFGDTVNIIEAADGIEAAAAIAQLTRAFGRPPSFILVHAHSHGHDIILSENKPELFTTLSQRMITDAPRHSSSGARLFHKQPLVILFGCNTGEEGKLAQTLSSRWHNTVVAADVPANGIVERYTVDDDILSLALRYRTTKDSVIPNVCTYNDGLLESKQVSVAQLKYSL